MKTKILFVSVIAFAMTALLAFTVPQEQKKGADWKVPAEYKSKVNPNKAGDADAIKIGKSVYAKHCRACHGNEGLGDGPKAKNLETFPGNFSDAKWQSAVKDGDLYYMSIIGRDEMPNYESKITDEEERWAVVTYIRSLKK